MNKEYFEEERYLKAKKRVKDIKGFYAHLFWYLVVNIFITFGSSISHIFHGGDLIDVDLHYGNFSVWFFWGIGLFFHWFGVFGKHLTFSNGWEERKIKEYMDKDKENL